MLSEWESKKRWTCPTDRQLTLRAKINHGWSIHTANVFLKSEPYEQSELEAIEKVIQRAQDLERLEIERVGRMVYKLENMTKNALGDGEKTCSMCGTTSSIFRSSFVRCVDCGKAVCDKCRVDTLTATLNICMLCKICSEDREVWKKSGGWFYGKLPTVNEACLEKSENRTSGSPNPVRAFDTWSHITRDIVRLQSYEPPAENHNDHSQYTDWSISPDKTELKENLSAYEDSDESEDDRSVHSQKRSSTPVNSVPDSTISRSTIPSFGQNSGGSFNQCGPSHHRDCFSDSAEQPLDGKSAGFRCPDIQFGETEELLKEKDSEILQDDLVDSIIPDLSIDEDNTQSSVALEPPRKRSDEKKQVNSPSPRTKITYLTPTEEPCKLRRKPSIRRKRPSTPT